MKHTEALSLHIDRAMTQAEREVFLETFCRSNPHYRGAHVADVLDVLYDTDSHVEKVDAMYEAHLNDIKECPRGLYSMCVFVAIYCQLGTEWDTIKKLMKRFNPK